MGEPSLTETAKPAPDVVAVPNVATSERVADGAESQPVDRSDPAVVDPAHNAQAAHLDSVDVPTSFLGLRPGDQLFIGVMLIVSLMLMAAQWVRLSGWGLREVEIERQPARALEYRIDINSATWVEWSQLEGIGETLAQRIVEYREQHGLFASIDDLEHVPGIGRKKLAAMRPWLTCEPPPARP